jgi:hypothetical protein
MKLAWTVTPLLHDDLNTWTRHLDSMEWQHTVNLNLVCLDSWSVKCYVRPGSVRMHTCVSVYCVCVHYQGTQLGSSICIQSWEYYVPVYLQDIGWASCFYALHFPSYVPDCNISRSQWSFQQFLSQICLLQEIFEKQWVLCNGKFLPLENQKKLEKLHKVNLHHGQPTSYCRTRYWSFHINLTSRITTQTPNFRIVKYERSDKGTTAAFHPFAWSFTQHRWAWKAVTWRWSTVRVVDNVQYSSVDTASLETLQQT